MTKHSTAERHQVLKAILRLLGEDKPIMDEVDDDSVVSVVEWKNGDLVLSLCVDDSNAYVALMGAGRIASSIEEAAALVRGVLSDDVVAVAAFDGDRIVYTDLAPADAPTRGLGRLDGLAKGDFPLIDRLQVSSWSGKLDHDSAKSMP